MRLFILFNGVVHTTPCARRGRVAMVCPVGRRNCPAVNATRGRRGHRWARVGLTAGRNCPGLISGSYAHNEAIAYIGATAGQGDGQSGGERVPVDWCAYRRWCAWTIELSYGVRPRHGCDGHTGAMAEPIRPGNTPGAVELRRACARRHGLRSALKMSRPTVGPQDVARFGMSVHPCFCNAARIMGGAPHNVNLLSDICLSAFADVPSKKAYPVSQAGP